MENMANMETRENVNQITQKSPEDFWMRKASNTFVDVMMFKERYSLRVCWREAKNSLFPPDTQFYCIHRDGWKNHIIRTWRTWPWVSSCLENVKRLLQPCLGGHILGSVLLTVKLDTVNSSLMYWTQSLNTVESPKRGKLDNLTKTVEKKTPMTTNPNINNRGHCWKCYHI